MEVHKATAQQLVKALSGRKLDLPRFTLDELLAELQRRGCKATLTKLNDKLLKVVVEIDVNSCPDLA